MTTANDAAVLEVSSSESEVTSSKKSSTATNCGNASFDISAFYSKLTLKQQCVENGFLQDIELFIDNPKKQTEGLETFLTYRINIRTLRCDFSSDTYVVRRRYNDFVWLRNKLTSGHSARIIPPLPCKHSVLGNLDRYSKEFIQFRIAMLTKFLNRVIRHPILSYDEHFKIFLTAGTAEFSKQRNSKGILTKVSESLHNLTVKYNPREKCPEFDDMKKYVVTFSEKLMIFDNIMTKIYKERKDLTSEMLLLSHEFEKWSSIETVLSPILTSIASTILVNSTLKEELLIKSMNSIVFWPIEEYILYADCVKEALDRRDVLQAQYELSLEEIAKKKSVKDELTNVKPESKFLLWKSSYSNEEKLESINSLIPQLMAIADINQDKLEMANEDLRSDLERWDIIKSHEIKKILRTLSDHYIQFYQKSLDVWEESYRTVCEPLYSEEK